MIAFDACIAQHIRICRGGIVVQQTTKVSVCQWTIIKAHVLCVECVVNAVAKANFGTAAWGVRDVHLAFVHIDSGSIGSFAVMIFLTSIDLT